MYLLSQSKHYCSCCASDVTYVCFLSDRRFFCKITCHWQIHHQHPDVPIKTDYWYTIIIQRPVWMYIYCNNLYMYVCILYIYCMYIYILCIYIYCVYIYCVYIYILCIYIYVCNTYTSEHIESVFLMFDYAATWGGPAGQIHSSSMATPQARVPVTSREVGRYRPGIRYNDRSRCFPSLEWWEMDLGTPQSPYDHRYFQVGDKWWLVDYEIRLYTTPYIGFFSLSMKWEIRS